MKNLTDITVLLDRTGSMMEVAKDTVGGLNTFIEKQKEVPGDAVFSLIQFDNINPYEVLDKCVPMKEVNPLVQANYQPRGSTPLYDAMGTTIVSIGTRLAALPEADRPDKVVVVIITDGEENSSKEYNKEKIRELVKEQQEKYSWNFIFLGADFDAMATGNELGYAPGTTMNVDKAKMHQVFVATSENIAKYRVTSFASSLNYTKDQREELA